MKILFIHQNFPGQFRQVVQALKARGGVEIRAITDRRNQQPVLVDMVRYSYAPAKAEPTIASNVLDRIARGKAVVAAMRHLKTDGFTPDVIIGHFGWGETHFVREVFPAAKLILYAEFYYRADGADIGFDPEFRSVQDGAVTAALKNAAVLTSLVEGDYFVAPTRWQASLFPKLFAARTTIIHDGIYTDIASPDPMARFERPAALSLGRDDEVITFVNRNLEPYRGYHIFMRALPKILARRPRAQVVIVGGDEVSYGARAPEGRSWKQVFLDEVGDALPLDRVHFVGRVPYADLLSLFRISSAHVYLTYPFVLSWSMLDAMSTGALVVASGTAPVREVIEDGVNGLLFDFFDVDALAEKVCAALAEPNRFTPLREAARKTVVERYDARACQARWLSFIDWVAKQA